MLGAVAKFAVSLGTSELVMNLVKATTPTNINIVRKGLIGVGSLALADIAGNAAVKYYKDLAKSIKDGVKEAKEKAEAENSEVGA